MSLHEAYVKSMMSGGALVKTKHGTMRFHQEGAGFGDWAKSMWGKAKAFVHRITPTLMEEGKKSLIKAGEKMIDQDGKLKDKLKAGFHSVKADIVDNRKAIGKHLLSELKSTM